MSKRKIASICTLVACGSVAAGVIAKAAEEDKEVKVAFKDVPAAVQKTMLREAFGAAIVSVDKESEDGKTVFEADAKIDGHNYEITVNDAGLLLKKKLDDDDDDESKEKVEKK